MTFALSQSGGRSRHVHYAPAVDWPEYRLTPYETAKLQITTDGPLRLPSLYGYPTSQGRIYHQRAGLDLRPFPRIHLYRDHTSPEGAAGFTDDWHDPARPGIPVLAAAATFPKLPISPFWPQFDLTPLRAHPPSDTTQTQSASKPLLLGTNAPLGETWLPGLANECTEAAGTLPNRLVEAWRVGEAIINAAARLAALRYLLPSTASAFLLLLRTTGGLLNYIASYIAKAENLLNVLIGTIAPPSANQRVMVMAFFVWTQMLVGCAKSTPPLAPVVVKPGIIAVVTERGSADSMDVMLDGTTLPFTTVSVGYTDRDISLVLVPPEVLAHSDRASMSLGLHGQYSRDGETRVASAYFNLFLEAGGVAVVIGEEDPEGEGVYQFLPHTNYPVTPACIKSEEIGVWQYFSIQFAMTLIAAGGLYEVVSESGFEEIRRTPWSQVQARPDPCREPPGVSNPPWPRQFLSHDVDE